MRSVFIGEESPRRDGRVLYGVSGLGVEVLRNICFN